MTFKKLASVLLPSVKNLMFGGKSLRPLNRSSTPVVFGPDHVYVIYISPLL